MIAILLPTDFSKNAMNAITYALEFFKYQKVEFYFMHAYQNEVYDHKELVSREVFHEILDSVRSVSQIKLENLVAEVKKSTPNPRYTYHVISSYSTLVQEANRISESKNIDLIVMGTNGKSNERREMFGSNTFQVLKYVKCPVLAIPAGYTNVQPKHILFPTDYMIPYKRRELKLLCCLAESYRSIISVLYVSKRNKLSFKQEDNQAFIKAAINSTEVDFYIENSNNIAQTIQSYVKSKAVDLLVMVNTHHSFLENLLFESNISKVGIDLKIPLFVMQNSRRCS